MAETGARPIAPDGPGARRAVLRLSTIEVWERYSFYSMYNLLPLFLATGVAAGGFGWSKGDTLRFFGTYVLVVQLAPLAGGALSDRWLGAARALAVGACLMLAGHFLLAAPHLIPELFGRSTGASVLPSLISTGAPLGGFSAPASLAGAPARAYVAISWTFYLAAGLIAVGNGLFKPTISAVVGRLPHAGPAERDAAFLLLYMCVNVGGVLASVGSGALAQGLGWPWAFAAAGFGMLIALGLMRLFRSSYRDVAAPAAPSQAAPVRDGAGPPASNWAFLGPLGLLLAFAVLFGVGYFQTAGFINLFTASRVDRGVFGLEIPPAWFVGLNPLFIVLFSPMLAGFWRRGGLGHDWSSAAKIAAGFLLMAAAFLILRGAAAQAGPHGLAHPLWIVGCIAVLTLAELLVGPIVAAAVSRIAPRERQGLAMGMWLAALGLGGFLSGWVGAAAVEHDDVLVLGFIFAYAVSCGAAICLFRRPLARLGI